MEERTLRANVQTIRSRISQAAIRAGRNPDDVRLIAVTKTVEPDAIRKAAQCDLSDFGENRVQEAQRKISDLKPRISNTDVTWHLIGHLQKNKAKTAVGLFDMIQSVDSVGLADALNKQAEREGKKQRILLQVKLCGEESKYGILKENVTDFIESILLLKNLKLEGLMTIPPFFDDPEMARPYFRELRQIRDKIGGQGVRLKELSMGMSNDFEVAIEEGATMVRIGTAIFGERRKKEEA